MGGVKGGGGGRVKGVGVHGGQGMRWWGQGMRWWGQGMRWWGQGVVGVKRW